MSVIYSIRNIYTGTLYIGSSKNYNRRFKEHLRELRHNKHSNSILQNAFNKYGEGAFIFEILDECKESAQYELEQNYIDSLQGKDIYNICKVVLEPPKILYTKEILYKIKIAQKNRANKPEEKKRLSKIMKDLWKNPEHIKYMKEINKGQNHPQSKITDEIAKNIKIDIKNKVERKKTLYKYKITVNIYKDIQRNKTWKHIII